MSLSSSAFSFSDLAVAASKITLVAISTNAATHAQFGAEMFGLPLPVLIAAVVGALMSLLFMDPLQGKQRRFLPLTILTFGLIGAAVAVVLPKLSFLAPILGEVPPALLGLLLGFLGHIVIPLLTVSAPAAVRARIAKWGNPDA
ncbi:hypothetical protein [Arenimonas oryziterrae]|uniref:Uncharacterized protein n=1 Tax=Arenimonas oryziterrae DSM 21050 = YC6267 TaxID=1121015 RepID=A0A091ATJ5_9GAMM|nr:hypothetical protein [Arenimonas oryziterrae]KFN42334.1 hypothetical protein N789_14185 [Arenimonas oryziterrae DSM 21050 = YC6267]